jgi:uncharacterized membrane protein
MMSEQANRPPKIKLTLTLADKVMEVISWVLLLVLWAAALLIYSSLPETIPTHFNASGAVDSYGSKSAIFILPIVGSAVFLLLTIVNFIPGSFNYAVAITPENAERQQRNATRLIRSLKCVLLSIFIVLVYYTSKAATDGSAASLAWIVPLLVGGVFLCIGYYLYKSFKMQ